jgi:hypothetical protein
MTRFLIALALVASPAVAQDFSEGSEAKEWGLFGESKARFTATVADPLCELTGQCAENCGNGDRQLVLVREVDGVWVFPLKNSQPNFAGGSSELAPYCGQLIEVDGLLITDPDLGAQNVYSPQRIKPEGSDECVKANTFTKVWWPERNPEAAAQKGGPWFRRDPRVLAAIEEQGFLGLGLETDAEFIAQEYAE